MTTTAIGDPPPSAARCNLAENPARLGPKAWSIGSPGGPDFFPPAADRLARTVVESTPNKD